MKKLRLLEFFAGYGSQHKAFDYLGKDVESYRTCEWAVKSIQALKDLHFSNDTTDYSKDLSLEELINYLSSKGISANYNEPMSIDQIKRLGESKLRTIYNNIKATHNLVNIQQVHGKDLDIVDTDNYEYMMTYSFPCLTNDSLILTKRGYIPLEDVTIDDYVLTKSNTWQKVHKKFDNGIHQTYYLQGMGFENIHCTGNHKFYVREMYRDGSKALRCFKEPEFKEAKDITKKDYFGVPVIQEEIPFYTDRLDFWYMLGMYIGDGWLGTVGNDIRIACNDEKLDKLTSMLNINKWKYTINKENTCYKLRFANKPISEFIKTYIGTGSSIKHIPYEILCLPREQLQAFYNGYLDSDGCIVKGRHQFTSINRNLIYSISCIINKLYKRPTSIYLNKVKPTKEIEGRTIHQHNWYQLKFNPISNKQDKAFYEDGYIWYPFTRLEKAEEEHVYNMEIENDHSYIVQGCISKNCQDLSNAGLRKGMDRDSGTRSGMLWEVERILKELKEQNLNLPNYLVMENVPQVHGTSNMKDFNDWCEFLKSIGYTNSWADLNSKNYGIPQNRERTFMVSILNNNGVYFQFPQPIKLIFRLKDLLEKNVPESYYLSDSKLNLISRWKAQQKPLENVLGNNSVCPTITARGAGEDHSGMITFSSNFEDKTNVQQDVESRYKGTYNFSASDTFMHNRDRFTEDSDTMNALLTAPKVGVVEEPLICASRGRNPENPTSRKSGEHLEQLIEVNDSGCSNCLTTVQKDNYVLEPSSFTDLQKQMITEDGNIKRYVDSDIVDTFEPGDCADISYPNGYGKGNRVTKQCAPTITSTTSQNNLVIKEEPIQSNSDYMDMETPNDKINVVANNKPSNHSCGRIISSNGLAPTVMENHGEVIKIVESKNSNLKTQLCNDLVKTGKVQEGDVIRHSYSTSRMEKMYVQNQASHECSPTLDTRCDCLGVCIDDDKDIDNPLKGQTPYGWHFEQNVFDKDSKCVRSIKASEGSGNQLKVMSNLRIRKLTPKECWRLMGIKDEDYFKVAKNQSNASLYHLAGDSIVTVCLMAIFGKMFNIDYREKIKDLLKSLNPNFDFSKVEPDVICEKYSLFDDMFEEE